MNLLDDVVKAIVEAPKLLESHTETVEKKRSALKTMLEDMGVPEMRRDTSTRANIHWLNRNLGVQNSEHPMLPTARGLVRWLLKEGV